MVAGLPLTIRTGHSAFCITYELTDPTSQLNKQPQLNVNQMFNSLCASLSSLCRVCIITL